MLPELPRAPPWLLVCAWCALDAWWPGLVRGGGEGGPPDDWGYRLGQFEEEREARGAELVGAYESNLTEGRREVSRLHQSYENLTFEINELRSELQRRADNAEAFFYYSLGAWLTVLITQCIGFLSFGRRRYVGPRPSEPTALQGRGERRRGGGVLQ